MTKKVVIVGAGPGGIAAAVTAAENGANVVVVDENPGLGGQIWRQQLGQIKDENAKKWIARLNALNIGFEHSTTVLGTLADGLECLNREKGKYIISFDKLILACGAKELFLPFPSWTLPGIIGAGGAQALVKSGLDVKGKRMAVSGSGPLLLAVASFLKRRGAKIVGIYEQAPSQKLNKLARYLLGNFPGKVLQGAAYRMSVLGSPWKKGWWVKEAHGDEKLNAITVTDGSRKKTLECDFLACGYGLKPNLELAKVLSCSIQEGFVEVNKYQETSVKDIYAVGEITGIGGLDKALAEGENAALSICDQTSRLKNLSSMKLFVEKLAETFELRDEVKKLSRPETIFCRCEDVPFGELSSCQDQRSAKLYSRCGMGACQGRICSSMGQEIFGWGLNKIQSPIVPVNVESLME